MDAYFVTADRGAALQIVDGYDAQPIPALHQLSKRWPAATRAPRRQVAGHRRDVASSRLGDRAACGGVVHRLD